MRLRRLTRRSSLPPWPRTGTKRARRAQRKRDSQTSQSATAARRRRVLLWCATALAATRACRACAHRQTSTPSAPRCGDDRSCFTGSMQCALRSLRGLWLIHVSARALLRTLCSDCVLTSCSLGQGLYSGLMGNVHAGVCTHLNPCHHMPMSHVLVHECKHGYGCTRSCSGGVMIMHQIMHQIMQRCLYSLRTHANARHMAQGDDTIFRTGSKTTARGRGSVNYRPYRGPCP